MPRRLFLPWLSMLLVTFWILACGDPLPTTLKTCQSHRDCSGQRLCVQQVCVSKGVAAASESTTGEASSIDPENVQPSEGHDEPATKVEKAGEESSKEEWAEEEGAEESSTNDRVDAGEPSEDSVDNTSEFVPEKQCNPGDSLRCYPFAKGSPGVGTCKEGNKLCTAQGFWGPCIGAVGPEAERCNGDEPADENCDGIINEGCPCLYTNSNQGECNKGLVDNQGVCQPPSTYKVIDICNDNLDNNCDGAVDENCQCQPGQSRGCGISVGSCIQGRQQCDNGVWGPCQGGIQPSPADKCGDLQDNNCNGAVDENCPCNFKNSSQGVCGTAKRDSKGQCIQPTDYNAIETCGDNLDNNCNGSADEGCPCDYMGIAEGVCKGSKTDASGNCQRPQSYSTIENCNDTLDNNCDGAINEGCTCNYNNKTQGVCTQAKRDNKGTCVAPAGFSSTEICGDNLDNNCDGVVDEGCPCNYLNRTYGVCGTATINSQGTCEKPATYSATENCNDNLDNNCDGTPNEGCACKPGEKETCGTDVGTCKKGIRTCQSNGQWGSCVGSIRPQAREICNNGADENCNGVADEYCPCNYNNQTRGVCGQAKRNDKGLCVAPANYSTTETCGDSVDNNCNGYTDENCPCNYRNINQGVCKQAKTNAQGICQPPTGYSATENCNDNLDNNCNGVVNEYCNCFYLGKTSGVCGVARRNGLGVCERPATYYTQDQCSDTLDNDCDGVINEFCQCFYKGINKGVCPNGRVDSRGTCQPPSNYNATERCGDNQDNNCNGFTEENCPCNYRGINKGVCASANRNATGTCLPPAGYASTEICDGKDNNCNGNVDDNIPGTGINCIVPGKRGECAKGKYLCVNGKLTCVADQPNAAPEICDGKDNDCNGKTDDPTEYCYRTNHTYCVRGYQACQGTTMTCSISVAIVLRCTDTSRCNQFCPSNKQYVCKLLPGNSGQKGCYLQ